MIRGGTGMTFDGVPCPSCGVVWTNKFVPPGGMDFPAFTACFSCAEIAYVDVGPFGFLVRPATPTEAALPANVRVRAAVLAWREGERP